MATMENHLRRANIARWIGRGWSLLSLAFVLAFAIGEWDAGAGLSFTATEWLLILCFPIGMAVGWVLGWWRERLGGLIVLGSLVAFYIIDMITSGSPPSGAFFALLAVPALFYLLSDLWRRQA